VATVTLELTPHQRDAALSWDRHVLVAAGAGSGKTRTVVARILYLLGVEVDGERIAEPLDLHRIAAITYTNKAASDLKLKLREALRKADRREDAYRVDTARFGTIHAFCGDVLREFGLKRGRNPSPRVLEEGEGLALVADVVRETMLEALEQGTVYGVEGLLAVRSASDVRGMVEQLLEESDRLRTIAANLDWHEDQERVLIQLALRALEVLEARLDVLGVVDFDRMIVWTRDLLKKDDYARRALRRRIHTLIVDEFQDVDPAQREIAYLLGDPTANRTDTTRLMLVGDAKQSIYRFRRADVSVWREVGEEFSGLDGASVLPLPENFRSKVPIIDFVDATIGTLLDTPIEGPEHALYEVPFEPLEVGDRAKQLDGPPVELILVPTKPEGKDYGAEEIRAIEAEALARRAAEMHEEGVEWGQMAVLLCGWGAVTVYQEALNRIGAPTFIIRTEGFYDRQEVADLLMALQVVHQPLDDRPLFGFLRGPFVGLKDESLLGIALSLERTPYWRRLERNEGLDLLADDERERAERGLTVLRRAIALRDRVPVDRLLQTMLDETGYMAHLALIGDERTQAIANVRKLVRVARSMRRCSVGEFLRVIEEARARGERMGDAPLHGEKDDVVTISTIHSAKGLEWSVVFWCDTVRQLGGRASDPLRGRDRIVLKDPTISRAKDQRERWRELKEVIDREEQAEDRRVWYVAVTRAKERLIVLGLPLGQREKPKLNTPAGRLWTVLPEFEIEDGASFVYSGAEGREHTGVVRIADPELVQSEEEPQHSEPSPLLDLSTLPGPGERISVVAGSRRHSATEMLTFVRCPRRHWLKYVRGLREPPVDNRSTGFVDAAARGNIVHDVLERMQEEDELDMLLEDAIGRWDEEAPPPESAHGTRYRNHLRKEVETVANNIEYRAIADLPSARRELGFLHIADEEHFYQGKIDLAAVEDEGYALLDVKTSQGDEKASHKKAKQYAPQRDVYVASVEGISGRDVGRFAFQFSRADTQVSEAITGETRAQIAESLSRRLEAMGGADPATTEHAWECRWCGYKKVGWCEGVDLDHR